MGPRGGTSFEADAVSLDPRWALLHFEVGSGEADGRPGGEPPWLV